MARAVRVSRADLEALLRARKLDATLAPAVPFPERLDERVVVPTGVAVLDEQLHGGVPRGQISEIVGLRSSGRTSLLFAMLAGATARGEMTALIDTLDRFDAGSAAACGIDLGRLLWIRGLDGSQFTGLGSQGIRGQGPGAGNQGPGAAETRQAGAWERAVDCAIKALNLVLQAGGFGLVALDLAEVPLTVVRRLPFTTWLRLQRVIEGSETACVLVGPAPVARSAGGVTISLQGRGQWSGARGTHQPRLFLGLEVEAHLNRARWPEAASCRFRISAAPWSLAPGS